MEAERPSVRVLKLVRACVMCGTEFKVNPHERRHRFCRATCRAAWHRNNPKARQANRLRAACLRILGRLQQGPATNAELLQIGGFRFGARLHELRRAGHKIRCDEDKATGRAVYILEAPE